MIRAMLIVVILVLIATIVYDQIKLHSNPVEYHFVIQTADFAINNINLVSTPNHAYLAGGYFLELTGGDPSVDNVIIDGRILGVQLFDMTQGEPFYRSDIMPYESGMVYDDLQINNKSVLHMKITYTISGKNKEYSEDILLKDKIKSSSSIGGDGYRLYELGPRQSPIPK